MILYLLRHAEAESDAPSDAVRLLTSKGRRQARKIGQFCRNQNIIPDRILTSPLSRAEETAEIVARELKRKPEIQALGFLSAGMSVESGLEGISSYRDVDKLMLVGHEPDFSVFAAAMTGGSIHFRKATLAALSLPKLEVGSGTLELLLPVMHL